ncbi:MAG TPA: NrfD/PsrC family molybdoenzyme membrane anchor subunit [Candidatus Binatia bacterium]|nr:NrfD/PsrC family molybdoenzyme membrane anchor subunit [Candidatus Binatia bacterium]
MLRVDPADKEKLIDPLFRVDRRFWAAVLVLLAVIGWGLYIYVQQVILGLGQTGMDRPTYWGIYMVNFIFFIGISHAGTLISAILRVTGAEWRRPITRVAEAITVFALIVGTLQIIIDMGRPDRLWFVALYGRLQSPILWDVVSVTLYFLGSVTYLYLPLIPDLAILRDNAPAHAPTWQKRLYSRLALGWRGNREQWVRLEKAIAVMAVFIIPVAVSVHTIISWILATTVQPGWHSSIFGPYFVVGAIFSGIGALFVAMSAVRRALGLENYITLRQYRNLGLLFIVMNLTWAYFTYAEHLGIAAGQQTEEFPVLASKLWGTYAAGFWSMVTLMVVAFIVLVAPKILSILPASERILRPQVAVASIAGALVTFLLLLAPVSSWVPPLFANAALTDPLERTAGWVLLIFFVVGAGLGLAPWLRSRPVAATVIASLLVLVGMWLERWNIVVPTMTHPRLVAYANYQPTITELSLTAASVALFVLLFLLFFKLFPAVSIWEVAEGRVVEEARAKISVPEPESMEERLRSRSLLRR